MRLADLKAEPMTDRAADLLTIIRYCKDDESAARLIDALLPMTEPAS